MYQETIIFEKVITKGNKDRRKEIKLIIKSN